MDNNLCMAKYSFSYILIYSIGDVLADNGVDYAVFIDNILKLSEQLKYLDPSYLVRDGEVMDMSDPEWLIAFRSYVENYMSSLPYGNTHFNEIAGVQYIEASHTLKEPTVTTNTGGYIDENQMFNENSINTQFPNVENSESNYDYQQEQPPNYPGDGISMYNPQAAYRSSFDQPPQQPLNIAENNIEQSTPFFMNNGITNAIHSQPSPSPETSDVIGYPSTGGSVDASPVHNAGPEMFAHQQNISESSQVPEKTVNYFGKSNFQPETSDTVRCGIFGYRGLLSFVHFNDLL